MLAVGGAAILTGVDALVGAEAGFGAPAQVRQERRRHDGEESIKHTSRDGELYTREREGEREREERRRGGWSVELELTATRKMTAQAQNRIARNGGLIATAPRLLGQGSGFPGEDRGQRTGGAKERKREKDEWAQACLSDRNSSLTDRQQPPSMSCGSPPPASARRSDG